MHDLPATVHRARQTVRFSKNKLINWFPEGPVSKPFVMWHNEDFEKWLSSIKIRGQQCTVSLLPSVIIDFANIYAGLLAGNSFIVRCHVASK